MSALLRLYPRAWRDRYGDELIAVLEARPPSLGDRLDVIRGALDARLHPQVPGVDTPPEKEIPMAQRMLGVVAAVGGIAWILAVLSIFVLPRQQDGYRDASLALLGLALAIATTGIALGELGTRRDSATSARTGHALALVSVVLGGLMLTPWPLFVFGLYGFLLLGVLAAWRGVKNGMLPRWFAIVFAVAAVATFVGALGGIDTDVTLFLIVLVGPAALLLGWSAFATQTHPPEMDPA